MHGISPFRSRGFQKRLEWLLSNGWIQPSLFVFGALLLLIKKKPRELYIVIDTCIRNCNNKLDKFPFPTIKNLFDKLL